MPSARPTAATGTFTQKIVRQPSPNTSASTSSPPASGPATEASPSTAPYAPNAFARATGAKDDRMMPNTCGTIRPPASPWATRVATSTAGFGASAHAAEAIANAARPIRKMRRRPNWSPIRPPVISPAPSARV
ncbi:hypothetical protein SRIMM317S_05159 [Streptomyces rimosus subsp. rimosus]